MEKFRHLLERRSRTRRLVGHLDGLAKMKPSPTSMPCSRRPKKAGLPWLPNQEREVDSSETSTSKTSAEEDSPDLTEKISKLRDKLKKAEELEKQRNEQKKKKAEKSPSRSKPKRRSRTPKRKIGKGAKEEKRDRSPDKKKKKARKRSRSPSRRKSPKGGKKKKRKQDADSSSSEPGLFGTNEGGHGDDESTAPKKKKDRGPFGTGNAEKFKDTATGSDTDDEKSVLREAPTQSQAVNQLRLEEYHQQHPGRLAARLLMKMSRETALNSVGARYLRETKTPPAALHYFQTMMVPGLGQKLNVRTARELRTLCVVLDCLGRDQPAHGADILCQRIKALEKSAQDGTWAATQFLELINPEQASLLDRAEQVYLAKELALENKVKTQGQRTGEPRGKGDQKGLKGKGQKGDGNKGNQKGKEKADTSPKA